MTKRIAPVILDLGAVKRRHIKSLKRGEGPLMDEVDASILETRDGFGSELDGKRIVPIILVYKEKSRKPMLPTG